MPKTVSKAPCQEVVLTGDQVDLDALPIMRCWPLDPAPFITLPAVITQDRATGVRNVGMYRMQKVDRRSTFMHWQIHKDGRADLLAAPDGRIPVAVALGLDPVTAYSASAPLPKHVGELMVAGFLKGSPVQLVACKTVDLEVPANAEIVLEGWVDASDTGMEGPFGDHTGFYTPPEEFPLFRISAITMRRDAIYPSIVVGKPPAEDEWLAKATERIFLPGDPDERPRARRLRPARGRHVPQLRDRLDPQALPRSRAQGDARDLGPRAALALEVGRRRRRGRRRPRLRAGVLPRLRERRPEARRRARPKGRSTSSTTPRCCRATAGKIGFDATAKGPSEGTREWPPEIEMTPEVKARVDARWAELGLPAHAVEPNRAEWRSSGPQAAPGDLAGSSLTQVAAGRLNQALEHGEHGTTE